MDNTNFEVALLKRRLDSIKQLWMGWEQEDLLREDLSIAYKTIKDLRNAISNSEEFIRKSYEVYPNLDLMLANFKSKK
jgi:bacterioferritin (cytochrome b1)